MHLLSLITTTRFRIFGGYSSVQWRMLQLPTLLHMTSCHMVSWQNVVCSVQILPRLVSTANVWSTSGAFMSCLIQIPCVLMSLIHNFVVHTECFHEHIQCNYQVTKTVLALGLQVCKSACYVVEHYKIAGLDS